MYRFLAHRESGRDDRGGARSPRGESFPRGAKARSERAKTSKPPWARLRIEPIGGGTGGVRATEPLRRRPPSTIGAGDGARASRNQRSRASAFKREYRHRGGLDRLSVAKAVDERAFAPRANPPPRRG
jgi:hypothetical protein